MASRLLDDWLRGYIEYTSGLKSPETYRLWAGLATIAGALQRRVWVEVEDQIQFPNLYLLLVGPPATGKSTALKIARDHFLAEIKTIHLTPSDITKAAFYEYLESAAQPFRIGEETETHSSVTGFLDEWSTFVEERDRDFMGWLADIYDNPTKRDKHTKTAGKNFIERPCFTMAGGVTLKQLRERFTDQALEGGFPSRVLLIYSDEYVKVKTGLKRKGRGKEERTDRRKTRNSLWRALLHDLEMIATMVGEYQWTDEAADAFESWVDGGLKPVPGDPKLFFYTHRRLAHATKLCIIFAAARSSSLEITLEDFEEARKTLIEAETQMPRAVAQLGASDQIEVAKLAVKVVEAYWKEHNKACPEHVVRNEIASEVKELYMVQHVLQAIEQMRWVEKVGTDQFPLYAPKGARRKIG